MSKSQAMESLLKKAARIFLVFALVFGTTLKLENTIAFAVAPVAVDDGTGHTPEQLTDLAIYEWSPEKTEWVYLTRNTTDTPANIEVKISEESGAHQFAAMPIWEGETLQSGAIPKVTSATFATWSMNAGGEAFASMVVGGDNVLTLTSVGTGSAVIKVKAWEVKEATFTANTTAIQKPGTGETKEPLINSVEILNKEGNPFTASPALVFKNDGVDQVYPLQASVSISNLDAGETYKTGEKTLAEFSNNLLDNLRWETTNPEVVKVDEKGLVTVVGKGECTISCIATVVSTTQSMYGTITVQVGEVEPPPVDYQGPSHAQDALQIYAEIPVSTDPQPSDSTVAPPEGTSGASGNSGSAAAAEPEKDPKKEPKVVDRTYTLAELKDMGAKGKLTFSTRGYTMQNSAGALGVVGNGFPLMSLVEQTFEAEGAKVADAPIESVDFIDYRGVATKIPWRYVKSADLQVAIESYVVPPKTDKDKDKDKNKVNTMADGDDSASSGGASGAGTGDGTGAGSGEAANPGDGTGEGAGAGTGGETGDGTGEPTPPLTPTPNPGEGDDEEEPQLLENTRYRILFNADTTSYDADALRYIKSIHFNMKAAETTELAVGISYVPVPLGVEAQFVASPNHSINGTWDCSWEFSRDRGTSWQKIDGAISQTLRILTTNDVVGTFYRVTIESSTAGADGKKQKATSAPVEMQIGSGFSVVLSYNPPKAGDLAVFRTSIYEYPGDVFRLEYLWEYSEDGGSTWNIIKGENKPSLKLSTKPQENAGGAGGSGGKNDGPQNLVYIRVRAITPDEQVRISNVQPLTVHVGDADTDAPSAPDDGPITQPTTPNKPAAPNTGRTPGASARPSMKPIEEIVTETPETPAPIAETPQAALDPSGTSTTPMVVLNQDIADQINKQQESQQELKAETVPGARWTSLKTMNPTADDFQRVLSNNPLVPYVAPFAFGLMAVGALEKFISYRRQLR